MMDDRKRVTAMYEMKAGKSVVDEESLVKPDTLKKAKEEYVVTIPSYAKKQDLQTLKNFLQEQKS